MKRIGADTVAFTGAGVGVAVVDTWVDLAQQDLDARDAFSAYGGSAQDDEGHGTHVAGIIAARNNTSDVVGVAPGATIYAVKVLDSSGSGSDATIIDGLNWVAANANLVNPPIRAVNMSLGRPGSLNDDPVLRTAVVSLYNAGISVVVAAGNDPYSEVSGQVPACYTEVMAVASTTAKNGKANRFGYSIAGDTASYFTTDGAGVAISAPGEDQEDVSNGYLISSVGILSLKLGGGTTRMSGTSMAAPHVAGVVALLWERAGYGSLSPATVRSAITAGAEDKGTAPLNSPTGAYTFDGTREGILSAIGALAQ